MPCLVDTDGRPGLSWMGMEEEGSGGQKLNWGMLELINATNQMELADVYRLFYPNPKNIFSAQNLMEHSPI